MIPLRIKAFMTSIGVTRSSAAKSRTTMTGGRVTGDGGCAAPLWAPRPVDTRVCMSLSLLDGIRLAVVKKRLVGVWVYGGVQGSLQTPAFQGLLPAGALRANIRSTARELPGRIDVDRACGRADDAHHLTFGPLAPAAHTRPQRHGPQSPSFRCVRYHLSLPRDHRLDVRRISTATSPCQMQLRIRPHRELGERVGAGEHAPLLPRRRAARVRASPGRESPLRSGHAPAEGAPAPAGGGGKRK